MRYAWPVLAFRRSGLCIEFTASEQHAQRFVSSSTRKTSDVRAAAIHSVAMWRDRDALKPLIELLSEEDPQLRRLSAMALGRIGESEAVKPLLDSYSSEMDPFLRHAIIYALYEIGDMQSLPANHLASQQVRKMQTVETQNVAPDVFPEIQLATATKPDPEKIAQQKQRLDELAAFLPKGDAQRGANLFDNRDKSKCIVCHLKGEKGVQTGARFDLDRRDTQ